jgi:hypothetical protein
VTKKKNTTDQISYQYLFFILKKSRNKAAIIDQKVTQNISIFTNHTTK